MLNKQEIQRYSRHLLLPEIGMTGQVKLKNASVLVIGAGGLGCPVLSYLSAAGVGKIGVADFDTVDESNLQRQILYNPEDAGKSKAKIAMEKLRRQNPFITFIVHNLHLNNKNALGIIKDYDVVIDGTDNFSTRYLVNDACVILNKPLVHGSIYRFEGQVSIFNYTSKDQKKGPSYRHIFPEPPSPESAPNCSETGVLGILPGIVGTLQAAEAIKLITGAGELLSGKLLLINVLTMDFSIIDIQSNDRFVNAPKNEEEFLKMNYDFSCVSSKNDKIKMITADELSSLLSKREELQFLDVREPGELPEIKKFMDLHIPLREVMGQMNKISREKKVIVFCQSGGRSKRAIELLQDKFHFTNLYNLDGGIRNWLKIHN